MLRLSKKQIPEFDSNKAMLSLSSIAYCENYYQYCKHIITYFDGADGVLNPKELAELRYMIACIRRLLQSNTYHGALMCRYGRLLKKLELLEISQANESN